MKSIYILKGRGFEPAVMSDSKGNGDRGDKRDKGREGVKYPIFGVTSIMDRPILKDLCVRLFCRLKWA